MSQLRNDAVDNLLGALVIAGHYIIPGKDACCIAEIALECLSIFCRVLFVFQPYAVPGEQGVKDVVLRPQRVQQSELPSACQWYILLPLASYTR